MRFGGNEYAAKLYSARIGIVSLPVCQEQNWPIPQTSGMNQRLFALALLIPHATGVDGRLAPPNSSPVHKRE